MDMTSGVLYTDSVLHGTQSFKSLTVQKEKFNLSLLNMIVFVPIKAYQYYKSHFYNDKMFLY